MIARLGTLTLLVVAWLAFFHGEWLIAGALALVSFGLRWWLSWSEEYERVGF